MTNQGLIKEFIEGTRKHGAVNHIGYKGNELYNYSTLLCEIDRANRKCRLNIRKYSTTTSKIQSALRYELSRSGLSIEEFNGDNAHMWNAGYMGATRLTARDFA